MGINVLGYRRIPRFHYPQGDIDNRRELGMEACIHASMGLACSTLPRRVVRP